VVEALIDLLVQLKVHHLDGLVQRSISQLEDLLLVDQGVAEVQVLTVYLLTGPEGLEIKLKHDKFVLLDQDVLVLLEVDIEAHLKVRVRGRVFEYVTSEVVVV